MGAIEVRAAGAVGAAMAAPRGRVAEPRDTAAPRRRPDLSNVDRVMGMCEGVCGCWLESTACLGEILIRMGSIWVAVTRIGQSALGTIY